MAFPLPNGSYGVCRVLRLSDESGGPEALVAVSDSIFEQPPTLADPQILTTLHLTHHFHKNTPALLWVPGLPPDDFAVIGTITLPPAKLQTEWLGYSAWEYFPIQLWLQWRWDHDRETVLREDKEEQLKQEELRKQEAEELKKKRATQTLDDLAKTNFFPEWGGSTPKGARTASLNILRQFIADLNQTSSPETIRDLTKTAVLAFNTLDVRHNHFIETTEREDIFDAFEQILIAAKHPELLDLIDQTRDW